MKITGLEVHKVALTSHQTYYMAAGKTCATVETVVVRVKTDTAHEGWGEVCPIPHYLPSYADGVAPALMELASVLIGADPVGAEAVMARCDAHLPGHVYAKSALDIALWDLTGKAANLPLYRLLGGRRMESAPVYHSITCVAPGEMARIARDALAQGVTQFQVKLGADDDWRRDVERLQAVREAVGPRHLVYGDWNCGVTKLHAIQAGRAAAELDVMLEQPCDTLEACAEVRHATGLPMKLDELCHDMATLLRASELRCLDVAALKLSKFGGVTKIREARDLCAHLGTRMGMEDTWGSDIATAASAHLAVSTHPKYLQNACDLSGYVSPRIAPDGPIRIRASLAPSENPGLGVTPDRDILGAPVAIIN